MPAKKKARPKDVGSGKPRHEKVGVKPGQSVAVVGKVDVGDDLKLLSAKKAKDVAGADWIYVAIDTLDDLKRIATTRAMMKDDAAIWCVWPKGLKGTGVVTESDVRNTALAGDLVDVKVMSWSATHSGLKLVVRKALRAKK